MSNTIVVFSQNHDDDSTCILYTYANEFSWTYICVKNKLKYSVFRFLTIFFYLRVFSFLYVWLTKVLDKIIFIVFPQQIVFIQSNLNSKIFCWIFWRKILLFKFSNTSEQSVDVIFDFVKFVYRARRIIRGFRSLSYFIRCYFYLVVWLFFYFHHANRRDSWNGFKKNCILF